MNRTDSRIMNYYDNQIISDLIEKYHYNQLDAVKKFINSETHSMLENNEYMLWEFGTPAVLDIFLCEEKTGNPRNSVYIKED